MQCLFAEPGFEVAGKIVIVADDFEQCLHMTAAGACLIVDRDSQLCLLLELLVCSEGPLATV